MTKNSHTAIRQSLEKRIQSGEWSLGDRIPDEIDLSQEYGCARTTVNRALQALANDGFVVRKRKGGTRVNPLPVRQAKFDIPIIREQVEATGSVYRHHVTEKAIASPTPSIRTRLRLGHDDETLYMETMHFADEQPFAFEMRWINTIAVPSVFNAPFDRLSANEWLVQTMPFSSGDVEFSAVNADRRVARALGTKPGTAIFSINRTTWLGDRFITAMTLFHRAGFQLYTKL
ncbi:MAG: UTRA domain-containing protein [Pseudomonadota bacterium]